MLHDAIDIQPLALHEAHCSLARAPVDFPSARALTRRWWRWVGRTRCRAPAILADRDEPSGGALAASAVAFPGGCRRRADGSPRLAVLGPSLAG
ncbi:MAG: hypothetical protein IPI27_09410 [Betaproteobacteria bacterium]|nr:hypothetical protein [Betaproteobacteria bacterium]